MAFRTGNWAKIWEIEAGERSTKVRISTSKKNKDTGEYDTDFSGYVALAGEAHKNAGQLKVGDTFKIGECAVTNRYDKEKKITYTNFAVFTFETNDAQPAKAEEKPAEVAEVTIEAEEDLPF